ncbi:acyltransferase [Gillisia sp. JM1]|uniref:acyltransferase n=1 Tax=Gillisia sp. JM1 TaxID=1283286 RepID=UPI00040DD5E5|nr:acyltransferase [Gillisia sp. JM1]
MITFKLNKVNISSYKVMGPILVKNKGKLTIGDNFEGNAGKMKNPIGGDTHLRLIVSEKGQLNIGENVGISNSTIVCWDKIEIGNFVFIGGNCKIWDTDFHSLHPHERRHNGDRYVYTAPIKIGDYVFIGGGSIILKGVSIGNNSIVAAGSVVTKLIPENEIWGGNPARFIKKLKMKNG